MYNGRYGNLPTAEAAQMSLRDIANSVTWDDIDKANDDKASNIERYRAGRLLGMIEGLQMVIFRNGGKQPLNWLPMLYRPAHEKEMEARSLPPQKRMLDKQITKDGEPCGTRMALS